MTSIAKTPTEAGARERLLAAAESLIYAGGIHATGVDAIVKLSGTARKSFYTHFESKDALVAAALERRDERWMRWFIDGTLKRGATPRARLIAMFDVLHEWFVSKDFHGCAFLNASGEIASRDDPIRVVAREHKERLLAFVREQCDAFCSEQTADDRAADAARLSRQWLILIDGAIGVALVSGDASAAFDARDAALPLLVVTPARGSAHGSEHGSEPNAGHERDESESRVTVPPSRRPSQRRQEKP